MGRGGFRQRLTVEDKGVGDLRHTQMDDNIFEQPHVELNDGFSALCVQTDINPLKLLVILITLQYMPHDYLLLLAHNVLQSNPSHHITTTIYMYHKFLNITVYQVKN